MIQLETKRLILRDPRMTDIGSWHRLISNPQIMYYLQDIMTSSWDESFKTLEDAIAEAQSPNREQFFLVMEERGTGAFVGLAGYTITQETPLGKCVWAGYFMLPAYQGQGLMTEAFREVIRFAFTEGDVYRVGTGCIWENQASWRVMEKCGLIKEAHYKDYVWHDGRLKDRVEYRLLRGEYAALEAKASTVS